MISPEKYQEIEREIGEFEKKYPSLKELDHVCPHEINIPDLRKTMLREGAKNEELIDYYLLKNLIATHNHISHLGNYKEVERTHRIVGDLEVLVFGIKVDNPL